MSHTGIDEKATRTGSVRDHLQAMRHGVVWRCRIGRRAGQIGQPCSDKVAGLDVVREDSPRRVDDDVLRKLLVGAGLEPHKVVVAAGDPVPAVQPLPQGLPHGRPPPAQAA